MWVKGEVQGFFYYFSAIRINECYAIAPAHTVKHPQLGLLIPALAGTGTNYLSDLGGTTTISEVLVHPEYDRSFAKPDIAIFKLSQPFVGSKPTIAPVGSLSVGEIVTAAGFGVPGFTNTGFSAGGNVRGWNAPILDEGSLLFNPTYFGHTGFSTTAGVSLNGRCSNGDSGAGVYDSDGSLVGMTIGSSPGTASYEPAGTSIFLDLTEPTIRAWVKANTVVPQPSIGCMVVAGQMQISLAKLVPTREYRIMRTADMLVWEEAHRFTSATASKTWSEPLVTGARRFYRLEWQD
jgi:hypothetical protein